MFEHLGTHVVGRAYERGGHVRRAQQHPRDAEVAQLATVVLHKDVPAAQTTTIINNNKDVPAAQTTTINNNNKDVPAAQTTTINNNNNNNKQLLLLFSAHVSRGRKIIIFRPHIL